MQENYPLLSLPGVRFAPTDVEMVRDYLMNKNLGRSLPCDVIREVDLSRFNPDQLTGYSIPGVGFMYFFTTWKPICQKGTRSSRQAGDGFWKATVGSTAVTDRGHILGYKRVLKFCKGTAQEGEKTPWLMDEYRINKVDHDKTSPDHYMNMWFLCRIHMNHQEKKRKRANSSLRHHDAEMDRPSNRCNPLQAFPEENSTKLTPTSTTWNESLALPWSYNRTSEVDPYEAQSYNRTSEVDNYEAQLPATCHDNAVEAPLKIDYGNWLCDGSHFIEEENRSLALPWPCNKTSSEVDNYEAQLPETCHDSAVEAPLEIDYGNWLCDGSDCIEEENQSWALPWPCNNTRSEVDNYEAQPPETCHDNAVEAPLEIDYGNWLCDGSDCIIEENQSWALPWPCNNTSGEVDNYEAQLPETCHDNAVEAPLEIDYGNWLCDGSHCIEEENQSLAWPWPYNKSSSEVDNYEAQLTDTCHDNAVKAPLEIEFGNCSCDGSHFIEEEPPVAITPQVISNFEAVMNSIAARSFDDNLAGVNCSASVS